VQQNVLHGILELS